MNLWTGPTYSLVALLLTPFEKGSGCPPHPVLLIPSSNKGTSSQVKAVLALTNESLDCLVAGCLALDEMIKKGGRDGFKNDQFLDNTVYGRPPRGYTKPL